MITKNLIFIFSILSSTLITAQQNVIGDMAALDKALEYQWFRSVFNKDLNNIEGSPYHNDEFLSAKISNYPDKILARYNSFHDNVEYQKDGKILLLPKEKTYNVVVFEKTDEKLFLHSNQYYFVLFVGKKLSLAKRTVTKLQEFVKATSGYEDNKPAKFYNDPDSYFLFMNNEAIALPKSQKKLAEMFPKNESEILTYIKQNKLNLKKENNKIEIVKFIDQLQN